VAQPVAQLGKLLGFRVTVIDDRPDYANETRFPEVDRVICDDFVTALQAIPVSKTTYVVLVTRGHRHDMACLRELIDKPLPYIGMIGSRVRVATVFRLLEEEHNVDPAAFKKVYAPIGLDIGARTPAEIAVAVAAELLKVRRGGTGESLSRLSRGLIHGR
jgi:xanthine dehydrogenase accessory factor